MKTIKLIPLALCVLASTAHAELSLLNVEANMPAPEEPRGVPTRDERGAPPGKVGLGPGCLWDWPAGPEGISLGDRTNCQPEEGKHYNPRGWCFPGYVYGGTKLEVAPGAGTAAERFVEKLIRGAQIPWYVEPIRYTNPGARVVYQVAVGRALQAMALKVNAFSAKHSVRNWPIDGFKGELVAYPQMGEAFKHFYFHIGAMLAVDANSSSAAEVFTDWWHTTGTDPGKQFRRCEETVALYDNQAGRQAGVAMMAFMNYAINEDQLRTRLRAIFCQ